MKRREFLKTAAMGAVVSASAVSNLNAASAGKTTKVTSGTHWCAVEATVKDGKVAELKPLPFDSKPTFMSKGTIDRVYAKTRVEYPYVREGFLRDRHKSDTTMRGKEKFVRVSWDTVNQIIYEEIARCQKQYGPDSIYAGSYGWFGVGNLNNPQTLVKRMLNLIKNNEDLDCILYVILVII